MSALKLQYKGQFKIKQHNSSLTKVDRILLCNTSGCQAKRKISTLTETCKEGDFFKNQHDHLPQCNQNKDSSHWNDPEFIKLLKLPLTPSIIINEYNKGKEENKKIISTEDVRSKISGKKYALKKGERDDMSDLSIVSISQLESFLIQHYINNIPLNQLDSFSFNDPIISGYNITGKAFSSFITSKNLLLNVVKQTAAIGVTFISADATYKLNQLGYPTVIIGTCDLNRKFHLGKSFLISYLFS